MRNRIISGLARAVVVVEAAAKSGSLITARNALDQGRDVMAVPGHPFDARAAGCNMLIRDGARLVRKASDILEELTPIAPQQADLPIAPQTPAPKPERGLRDTAKLHQAILRRLGPTPVARSIDRRSQNARPAFGARSCNARTAWENHAPCRWALVSELAAPYMPTEALVGSVFCCCIDNAPFPNPSSAAIRPQKTSLEESRNQHARRRRRIPGKSQNNQ